MPTATDFGALEQATIFADWAARPSGSRRSLTRGVPVANTLSAAVAKVVPGRV